MAFTPLRRQEIAQMETVEIEFALGIANDQLARSQDKISETTLHIHRLQTQRENLLYELARREIRAAFREEQQLLPLPSRGQGLYN